MRNIFETFDRRLKTMSNAHTRVGEYLSACLAAFSMQEGTQIRVLSLSLFRLFSPLLRTVEALLGNNVSVPYLFMCDRTRCQSAAGKR